MLSMKKKVLIFIPKFPALTETFIEREVAKLVERENLDVTVISLEKGDGSLSEFSERVTKYERLTIPNCIGGAFYFFTRTKRVFLALQEVGFSHLYSFLKGVGYAYAFSKYNPDIIYAHFLSYPSTVALVASIVLDVEFAISAHARDILEYPDLPDVKAKHSKFITICNKNACKRAKELSGLSDTSSIKLMYHGLDPDSLSVEDYIKKDSPPLILSVGRYVEKKGQIYLIEAAKMLKDWNRQFKVVIVGGGLLHRSLQKKIESLGLQDTVELVGALPFEEIKRYLHKASYFVLPLVQAESGDADGIANTLIEAAMVNVPIVATDAGSTLDFLDDQTALIVSQHDSKAVADAILNLMDNPKVADTLVANSYKKATEMFDIDNNIEQIERMLLT